MYCTNCGFKLEATDRFCAQCGRTTNVGEQPPPSGYYAPRRLTRPMHDKAIAGVCSGVARYLDVDVSLIRIAWLCVAIFTGVGFIAYLVAWIVMPKDYGPPQPAHRPQPAAPPDTAPQPAGSTAT